MYTVAIMLKIWPHLFSHNKWASYANKFKPLFLRMRLHIYQLHRIMATLSTTYYFAKREWHTVLHHWI